MACASSCKTQDHPSYGACLRSKNVATCGLESTGPGFGMSAQKKWDNELDRYEAAVAQGIQPEGTKTAQIDAAVEASNVTGVAFNAETTQVSAKAIVNASN